MDKHSLAKKRLSRYLHDYEEKEGKYFKSAYLSKHYIAGKKTMDKDVTIHNIDIERLLIKCCRDNNCYPAWCYSDNLFKLVTFSLRPTDEKYLYLYHQTNIPPEIILKEGLKIRYSFSLSKGFPPLLFLANEPKWWYGEYTYKVRIKQQLYFDTNLNHKCRVGNNSFCVKNSIPAHLLEVITK